MHLGNVQTLLCEGQSDIIFAVEGQKEVSAKGIQPTGTITFLFSDVEGSTRLWEAHTDTMRSALRRHDQLIRETIERCGGYIFKTVGDAFCAAFASAPNAVLAAVEVQRALRSEKWDLPRPIRVRIGLHSGEAEVRDNDYFGPAVNRAARLESLAFGGQTILSLVTAELVRDNLPDDTSLVSLGNHRLKDLTRPETVFELRFTGQVDNFAPLKSLDAHLHNLPFEPTSLIGREQELEHLKQELLGDKVRFLTLVGPGGIGKTRMAIQLAADLIDSFPDGAYIVDLSPVRAPNEIAQTIAETLRITESTAADLSARVIEHLSRRRMILVLDNFEQVIEGSGEVARLTAGCPDLKIIVTSREALRLRGEHVFHVPPLALPPAQARPGTPGVFLSQYEAVRLFIDRALDQDSDFVVTNASAPAVAEICIRLDGIPLAIELAAARIGLLSPQELLLHLSARLELLVGGPRDLPQRQRALRATIDWSFELLTEEERIHFAQLSVFAGGFTIDACEQVCIDEDTDLADVLRLTQSLVDKSLLVMARHPEGGSRFSMLETIREFAAERFELLPHKERTLDAHAAYYLAIATHSEARLEGPEQRATCETIDKELSNIRAALEYLAAVGSLEDHARIVTSLGRYWQLRGYCTEGRNRFASLLATADRLPEDLVTKAHVWLSVLAREQGDYDTAENELKPFLAEGVQDSDLTEFALHEGGWNSIRRHEMTIAADRFTRGHALAARLGDELYQWKTRLGLVAVAQIIGNHPPAVEALKEAREFFHKRGYLRLEAQALGNLGYSANANGDLAEAARLFEQLLPISEDLGDIFLQFHVLNNLGDNYLQSGQYSKAFEQYDRVHAQAERTGHHRFRVLALSGMADAARGLDDIQRAVKFADRAVAASKEAHLSDGYEPGNALRVAADLHWEEGKHEEARGEYQEAIRILRQAGAGEAVRLAEAGFKRASERSVGGGAADGQS